MNEQNAPAGDLSFLGGQPQGDLAYHKQLLANFDKDIMGGVYGDPAVLLGQDLSSLDTSVADTRPMFSLWGGAKDIARLVPNMVLDNLANVANLAGSAMREYHRRATGEEQEAHYWRPEDWFGILEPSTKVGAAVRPMAEFALPILMIPFTLGASETLAASKLPMIASLGRGLQVASKAGKLGKFAMYSSVAALEDFIDEPTTDTFSTMLAKTFPTLGDRIPEAMLIEMDDSEFKRRLARATEGFAIGAVADVAIEGMSLLRNLLRVSKYAGRDTAGKLARVMFDPNRKMFILGQDVSKMDLADFQKHLPDIVKRTGDDMLEAIYDADPDLYVAFQDQLGKYVQSLQGYGKFASELTPETLTHSLNDIYGDLKIRGTYDITGTFNTQVGFMDTMAMPNLATRTVSNIDNIPMMTPSTSPARLAQTDSALSPAMRYHMGMLEARQFIPEAVLDDSVNLADVAIGEMLQGTSAYGDAILGLSAHSALDEVNLVHYIFKDSLNHNDYKRVIDALDSGGSVQIISRKELARVDIDEGFRTKLSRTERTAISKMLVEEREIIESLSAQQRKLLVKAGVDADDLDDIRAFLEKPAASDAARRRRWAEIVGIAEDDPEIIGLNELRDRARRWNDNIAADQYARSIPGQIAKAKKAGLANKPLIDLTKPDQRKLARKLSRQRTVSNSIDPIGAAAHRMYKIDPRGPLDSKPTRLSMSHRRCNSPATVGGALLGAVVGGGVDIDGDGQITGQDIVMGALFGIAAGVAIDKFQGGFLRRASEIDPEAWAKSAKSAIDAKVRVNEKVLQKLEYGTTSGATKEIRDRCSEYLLSFSKYNKALKEADVDTLLKGIRDAEHLHPQQLKQATTLDLHLVGKEIDDFTSALMDPEKLKAAAERSEVGRGIFDAVSEEDMLGSYRIAEEMLRGKLKSLNPKTVKQMYDRASAMYLATTGIDPNKALAHLSKNTDELYARIINAAMVLKNSRSKFNEIAQDYLAKHATGAVTKADTLALNEASAVIQAQSAVLRGSQAEIGRALGIMRHIKRMTNDLPALLKRPDLMEQISQGLMTEDQLVKMLTEVTKAESDREAYQILMGQLKSKAMDLFSYYRYNAMLSGPATLTVNAVGGLATTLLHIGERVSGAFVSTVTGQGDVAWGEISNLLHTAMSSVNDAMRIAGKAAKAGMPLVDYLSKFEAEASIKAFQPMNYEGTILGELMNSFGGIPASILGTVHSVIGTPTRALTMTDEFFKFINWRMNLHDQLWRKANSEAVAKSLTGAAKADFIDKSIANMLCDTGSEVMRTAAQGAHDFARYQAFQAPLTGPAKALQNLANAVPLVKMLAFPFVRTPMNIMRYAMERFPILGAAARNDMVDLATGGARASMVKARYATSIGLMYAGYTMAAEGYAIGNISKNDKGMLQAGYLPYSVKYGGKWHTFDRLDPVSSWIGFGADMHRISVTMDEDSTDSITEIMCAGIQAMMTAFANKTYFNGAFSLMDALRDPEEPAVLKVSRDFAASLVPNLAAVTERATNPELVEAWTIWDSVIAKIPGMADDMPTSYDYLGEARISPSHIVAPTRIATESTDPIRIEAKNLGYDTEAFKRGLKKIGGYELTPQEHSQLMQYIGPRVRTRLGQMLNTETYKNAGGDFEGISGQKRRYWDHTMGRARREGIRDYLKTNPDLAQRIREFEYQVKMVHSGHFTPSS